MKALGKVEPDYPHAAHHIVAGGANKASDARAVLTKYRIDVDNASNGVFLRTTDVGSGMKHTTIHTNNYYKTVNVMLEEATSKEDAISILNIIGEMLQNGTFPK